ncbi:MAG: hypothetical protein R2751_07415 [Bacteroidales bacterium]
MVFQRISSPTPMYLRWYILLPVLLGIFYLTFSLFYSEIKKNTVREFNNGQLLLAETAGQGMASFLENQKSNLAYIAKREKHHRFFGGGNPRHAGLL